MAYKLSIRKHKSSMVGKRKRAVVDLSSAINTADTTSSSDVAMQLIDKRTCKGTKAIYSSKIKKIVEWCYLGDITALNTGQKRCYVSRMVYGTKVPQRSEQLCYGTIYNKIIVVNKYTKTGKLKNKYKR